MDWLPTPVFLGFPCRSAGKESACNVGDLGLIPGLGRSLGERKGSILAVFYPLQYTVHGVAKSWTWLSDFHFHFLYLDGEQYFLLEESLKSLPRHQEKWIVPSILSDLEWYFPILLFTLFIIVPWGCCLCLFPKPCPPTRKCWYDRYIMYLFICYMYIFALCMKRRNFSYQELIFQHYWGWYSL